MAEGTKNKNSNILIIGLFSFLITVVIAGTFVFITLRQVNSGNTHNSASVETVEEIGPLVPLGNEIIINIPGEDGEEHYLKVNVTLEVQAGKDKEDKAKEEVTKRIPQFRDLIISILSTKTKEKIDEKEGKDLIRSEIITNINRYLLSCKVKNLFFEDFVIQ
jgi:flagellar protein FliL